MHPRMHHQKPDIELNKHMVTTILKATAHTKDQVSEILREKLNEVENLDEDINASSNYTDGIPKKRLNAENGSIKQTNQVLQQTSPAQRALAGRKPIRAIISDLNKRIQMLKNNPVQWEILQAKICI